MPEDYIAYFANTLGETISIAINEPLQASLVSERTVTKSILHAPCHEAPIGLSATRDVVGSSEDNLIEIKYDNSGPSTYHLSLDKTVLAMNLFFYVTRDDLQGFRANGSSAGITITPSQQARPATVQRG